MIMTMTQSNKTGNRINIQPRFLTTPAIYSIPLLGCYGIKRKRLIWVKSVRTVQ
jgi:hypothetical protein